MPEIEHDGILIGSILLTLIMGFVVKVPLMVIVTTPFLALVSLVSQGAHSFPYLNIVLILVAVLVLATTVAGMSE